MDELVAVVDGDGAGDEVEAMEGTEVETVARLEELCLLVVERHLERVTSLHGLSGQLVTRLLKLIAEGRGLTRPVVQFLLSVGLCITEFRLPGTELSSDWLRIIKKMPDLQVLHLEGTDVSYLPLMSLSSMKGSLLELNLKGCARVSDAALGAVGRMTALTKLTVGSRLVTVEGLSHFTALTNLEHLSLFGCSNVSRLPKILVKTWPSLIALDLSWTGCEPKDLRRVIGYMTSIVELRVAGLDLTDSNLTEWPKSRTRLRVLDLSENRLSLPSTLHQLPSLHHLIVSNIPGLSSVEWVPPSLYELDLSFTGVTDECMAHLARACPRLRVLSLRGTYVTSEGMQRLRPLAEAAAQAKYGPTRLHVDARDCNLTSDDVSHLKQSIPDMVVATT